MTAKPRRGKQYRDVGLAPKVVSAELDTGSEAKMRGHLKSDNGEEQKGSSSYVPKDKANDKQLQTAIDLLHGKPVGLRAASRTVQ